MKRNTVLVVSLTTVAFVTGSMAAVAVQDKTPKSPPVKRVKRPHFTERDWDGIYFENLFEEGLVGERPNPVEPGQLAKPKPTKESTEQGINWLWISPRL